MAEAEPEDGRSPPREMESISAAPEEGERRGRWALHVPAPAQEEPRPLRLQVAPPGAAPRDPKRCRLPLQVVRMAPDSGLTWMPRHLQVRAASALALLHFFRSLLLAPSLKPFRQLPFSAF